MTAAGREVTFESGGVRCSAVHLRGTASPFDGDAGRPCVVMAHGFGGTLDTGLLPFAEGFAAAGLDVLVFDYRGFGTSGGALRQRICSRHQREDYRAAVATARGIEGVDPDRIVLWGTSYSGGHVLPVAADDTRIAAVLSLTPAMDGAAVLKGLAGRHPWLLARLVAHGAYDLARAALGRSPHHVAVVGPPGSAAMITSPGAVEAYTSLAGPSWRNEVCARACFDVARNRPGRAAPRVRQPVLVQVATHDSVASPDVARRTAGRVGGYAELHRYPVDHFDVYEGLWQQHVLDAQVDFLRRQLVAVGGLTRV